MFVLKTSMNEGQQQKSGSFASLRMTVWGGYVWRRGTTKVQVLRFAQDDGVRWLCLVEGQQRKSRSFASLRMTVWGGCV